eukprot:scaffold20843_cov61-Attheya_sp.AAC.1
MAVAQALLTGGSAEKNIANEIQIAWWCRNNGNWTTVLEEEYLSTRRIRYRPLTAAEDGIVRVNCVATVIRVIFNDTVKEIKATCLKVTNTCIVSKLRSRPRDPDAPVVEDVPPTEAPVHQGYIVEATGRSRTSTSLSSSFTCNGECSFVKQLRETLSVEQQTRDDKAIEYQSTILVLESRVAFLSTPSVGTTIAATQPLAPVVQTTTVHEDQLVNRQAYGKAFHLSCDRNKEGSTSRYTRNSYVEAMLSNLSDDELFGREVEFNSLDYALVQARRLQRNDYDFPVDKDPSFT